MKRFAVGSVVLHYYEFKRDGGEEGHLLEFVRHDVAEVKAETSDAAIDQVLYPLMMNYPECAGYLCRVKATEIAEAEKAANVCVIA